MAYKMYVSPDSTKINRLIVIYPGMDALTEPGAQQFITSNNINRYDIFAKFTAVMSEPGAVVIVPEYPAPYAWGKPIDFSILTNEIEHNLQEALHELRSNKLNIDIQKIDLGAHSYGFVALFWSLANEIFGRLLQKNITYKINLHLFDPYAIAAMHGQPNTDAFRDQEVIVATQQRFYGIADAIDPVQTAQNELRQLKSFDHIRNINIMLGMLKPLPAIHNSYGAINPYEAHVNLMKLERVASGGGLLDILKAQLNKEYAPEDALTGFQILMNAWVFALQNVSEDHSTEAVMQIIENIQKKIDELCIHAGLMAIPEQVTEQTLKPSL